MRRVWTRMVCMYYTSINRRPNALTPLIRFVVDSLYNLFVNQCSDQILAYTGADLGE